MMRRFLCTLTLALPTLIVALTSQQSQAESALTSDTNRSVWVARTVTPGGRARVTITKSRPKYYLAKVYPKLFAGDQDTDYYDDQPDLQVGYRRPELVDQTAEIVDPELSDEIKIRLVIARMKAMQTYNQTWT